MTTILLSYNEVQSLARKAASGAGLPHGVADDIGQAAAWLSARGVDAIGIVVAALAGQGLADILDGLSAIDALCGGEMDAVTLRDGDLLLIGIAGAMAREAGLNLAVDRGGGDIVPLASLRDVGSLASVVTLRRMAGNGEPAWPGAPRPAPTDAAAYATALALATKTYVPGSDLSRAKGAGAGTTDND
jgi:hypothetical protein